MFTRENMERDLARMAWSPSNRFLALDVLAFSWSKWAGEINPVLANPSDVPDELLDAQRAGFGSAVVDSDVRFVDWSDL
jgi:hypothetical protein